MQTYKLNGVFDKENNTYFTGTSQVEDSNIVYVLDYHVGEPIEEFIPLDKIQQTGGLTIIFTESEESAKAAEAHYSKS